VIGNGYSSAEDRREGRKFDELEGNIEYGRPLDLDGILEPSEVGAQVYGRNSDSIGICLIHKDMPYTLTMIFSLITLIRSLMKRFNIPVEEIIGHYEVDTKKPQCPSIDMPQFRKDLATFIDLGSGISKGKMYELFVKYCQ
jgi:hypothetical protein